MVNIQQGFEAITGGVCSATVHRVVVCLILFPLMSLCTPAEGRMLMDTGAEKHNAIQYPVFHGDTDGLDVVESA